MSEQVYWIMTAATWGLIIVPLVIFFMWRGEKRKAGFCLCGALMGGVPSMMGHLALLH